MSIFLLRPDSDYSAGYASADEIEDTLREISNAAHVFRAALFGGLTRINEKLPVGSVSPKATDWDFYNWFCDSVEDDLKHAASKARDGWE